MDSVSIMFRLLHRDGRAGVDVGEMVMIPRSTQEPGTLPRKATRHHVQGWAGLKSWALERWHGFLLISSL